MNKKCLKNAIFTLFALVLILGLSFGIKADARVTDNEQSAINALSGNLVCSINDAYQERYFKANIIKNLNRNVGVISIGSSHLMTLSSDAVKGDYINLAVGGANLQDRLNILGLLDLYNIQYNKVVYEIDIASFLPTARKIEKYNSDFKKYGDYFYNKFVLGINSQPVALDFNDYYINEFADNAVLNLTRVYDKNNLPHKLIYYKPDASQGYPRAVYEEEKENKKEQTGIIINNDKIFRDTDINKDSIKVVDTIMKYFHDKGIEIEIVVIPRPPSVYDGSEMLTSKYIASINELIYKYYVNYNVKVCGSFNPHDLDVAEDDYYDALHLKPESITRLYTID
ncbi:MAG: hypothetical protein IKP66_01935 [Lachnospiraceae bacterium]|nr:hypothetical protein [Lachnospiraceae bacterium]